MNSPSFQRKRLILGPYPSHGTPKLTAPRHAVLLYLEGMQSDPPDSDAKDTDSPTSPRSQTVPARVTSPMLRGSNSGGSGARRSPRSELSYVTDKRQNGLGLNGVSPAERDNDIRSDVQEGRDSEVRTTGHVSVVACSVSFSRLVSRFLVFDSFRLSPQVEHSPEDGPGVRHESLDSSFGNMGQPSWDQQVSSGVGDHRVCRSDVAVPPSVCYQDTTQGRWRPSPLFCTHFEPSNRLQSVPGMGFLSASSAAY